MIGRHRAGAALLFALGWGVFFPAHSGAQSRSAVADKCVQAVHTGPVAPLVDGRLDDSAWARAEFVADFLQKEPEEGAPPTDRTEVAVLFDAEALYIGARLFTRDPEGLRMHLDRRDTQGPAEQFIVSIDAYRDRRTACGFGVNAAGVRFDRYNPEDQEHIRDYSFNPVWAARTARDSAGWTLEMRIPFSQLRFNEKPEQIWGINFNRWIPARNEDIYWIYVPRDETGWASRFGRLVGLGHVAPARRLEFVPYTATEAGIRDGDFAANPFTDGRDFDARLGADLKMGLGPHLTLDATFNPDFGQVEADPAVVNLSAFETFFSERRPFFTEGSRVLEGEGPDYFYSRRIGAPPHGSAAGEFIAAPAYTGILGAAKVSGRLRSGASLGVLSAVTRREYARSYDSDSDFTWRTPVEPLTLYSVARLQQEFGPHQSTAGVMFTAVERELGGAPELWARLHRRAYTGGADWRLRLRDGEYEIRGFGGFSHVAGSPEALRATQESSARYFQRPDADYVSVDPERTAMTGYTGALAVHRGAGRHWLWYLEGAAESPDFELNDAGRLAQADDLDLFGSLVYRETLPGRLFRNYAVELSAGGNWNYGGDRQYSEVSLSGSATWHGYWNTWALLGFQLPGQNDHATRGGPSMKLAGGRSFGVGLNSNFAAATQYGGSVEGGDDDLGGWWCELRGRLSARLGTRVQLAASPWYRCEEQPRQYVAAVSDAGGGVETYGVRYVFARIERSTLGLQLRASYFFTPDLSLELYAEPFAASGFYYDHGELIRPRDNALRVYADAPGVAITETEDGGLQIDDNGAEFTLPGLDFGERSFRSNLVLRWEFVPGSTLFLVWQRNLSADRDPGRRVRPGALLDALGAGGDDFVALKVSYWLPAS